MTDPVTALFRQAGHTGKVVLHCKTCGEVVTPHERGLVHADGRSLVECETEGS